MLRLLLQNQRLEELATRGDDDYITVAAEKDELAQENSRLRRELRHRRVSRVNSSNDVSQSGAGKDTRAPSYRDGRVASLASDHAATRAELHHRAPALAPTAASGSTTSSSTTTGITSVCMCVDTCPVVSKSPRFRHRPQA